MANSYSGITRISFLHHQTCHRLTYNVTAAQYHTFFSLGFNVVTLQQFQNTIRRSGYIARKANGHTTYIDRVKTIHIFTIVNGLNHFLLGNMLR